MNTKSYKYAYIDFSQFNFLYPEANEYFFMAPLGHYSTPGIWNHIFDGIFYIKDTYNCTPISKRP